MVGPRRKKLMNRVVVGAVNLDSVETGLSSQRRSLPEACNQAFDLVGRHGPWRRCAGTQRCNWGRRAQTLLADQLRLCDPAAIIDLEDRQTSASAHGFGEPMQTGQVSLMCRAYSLPGAAVLFDVSGGRDGECKPAGGTAPHEFEFVVGNRTVLIGSIGRQRGHRKPVRRRLSA